jgi:hypothetical protein
MIDRRFIERWSERLRTEIPGAAAVLLKGSYATGTAGPWSDVDFDVLVDRSEPVEEYRAWLVDGPGGHLVHVSVAVTDIQAWLEAGNEPATWAPLGFPAREMTMLLWSRDDALRERLDHPHRDHPALDPELEDFIEDLGKARNAHLRGDVLSCRVSCQELAKLCPTLLVPLNALARPATRSAALTAALDLAIAPPGYRDDMLLCLGLSGQASTANEVLAAAERLVSGTLSLLRDRIDAVAHLLPSDLAGYLVDGTLQRYLERRNP